jgi:FKBP-type peptidyl-prolyl cis-trans isomerase
MRLIAPIVLALATALPLAAGDAAPAAEAQPQAQPPQGDELRKRVSFLIGLRLKAMVDNAVQQGQLDRAELLRGLAEAEAGNAKEPDMAEQQALFQAWDAELQSRMAKGEESKVADNTAFLAERAKQQGVTATVSGLQYEVLSKGAEGGKQPTAQSQVKVHYTGTKRDGSVFDSSVQRGEPVTFPLDGVIKGWTEGLQLMREGDKYRFAIPSDLAYGPAGTPGGPIGPNEVLFFEVELIQVLSNPKG